MYEVNVTGLKEAITRFRLMRQNLQDPQPALYKSAVVVRDAAVWRIKQQGGDQVWAPTLRGGHIGIDTGRMWQSIGISQSSADSIDIGTNVKYARWFQEGTGIYGPTGQPIKPKTGNVLSWEVNGVRYFAKSVDGMPARPFLLITDTERKKIRAIWVRRAKALPETEGWT